MIYHDDDGCAYLIQEGRSHHRCGDPQRLDSAYCPHHHAICHLTKGSEKEAYQLRLFDSLARAGGRMLRRLG